MATIIVTDLTHFNRPNTVCIAGIDIDNHNCVRPLPYFTPQQVQQHNIQPGVRIILDGNFAGAQPPHCEDFNYNRARIGEYSPQQFQEILENILSPNIEAGFGVGEIDGKCINYENPPAHSIITIAISGRGIRAVADEYTDTKIKIHIIDNDAKEYSFLPCAQLVWHNAAENDRAMAIRDFNNYSRQFGQVYVRVGVGRRHAVAGRDGFWLQLNGVYGF